MSIGVRVIRNVADESETNTVLTSGGHVRESRRAKIPALAAVSPKRERGPWKLVRISTDAQITLLEVRGIGFTHRAAPKPA